MTEKKQLKLELNNLELKMVLRTAQSKVFFVSWRQELALNTKVGCQMSIITFNNYLHNSVIYLENIQN